MHPFISGARIRAEHRDTQAIQAKLAPMEESNMPKAIEKSGSTGSKKWMQKAVKRPRAVTAKAKRAR